jgi:dihydrofolate synthase / folylpolyglutamate synthase
MNYQETLDYLYAQLPMFHRIGAAAYKNTLENTLALDRFWNHPHRKFRTVHVAGTNGKGSVSHSLAAIMQCAGYKTGLYTSPHLVDFRERIRINGAMISEEAVVGFVEQFKRFNENSRLEPSFFELTVAMAFDYFAAEQVDVAVVEVGLGGRLDSTNIITPDLSLITNISFDHTNLLGNTLSAIAGEKAGIIKPGIPVLIGESHPETRGVFLEKAEQVGAPVFFAEERARAEKLNDNVFRLKGPNSEAFELSYGLNGDYQSKNLATVYAAVDLLRKQGYTISDEALVRGLAEVCSLTGLQGRWQTLGTHPLVICDTGHNEAGIAYVVKQLEKTPHLNLLMVIGMVNDKAIDKVLALLPREAFYYFTQAAIERALGADELRRQAQVCGLNGSSYPSVKAALEAALAQAGPDDLVFIGGSTYVVGEAIECFG